MKKIILIGLIAFAVIAPATHANAWSQYQLNNIHSACVQQNQKNPTPAVTSKDYGCACFVKNISANMTFDDLRKTGEHSKYTDYLIETANKKCNSNYSF